jgi:hypothetical protein
MFMVAELEATAIVDTVGVDALEARRSVLESRLEIGFNKIEQAEASGQDVSRWNAAWHELLAEYVEICDKLIERP